MTCRCYLPPGALVLLLVLGVAVPAAAQAPTPLLPPLPSLDPEFTLRADSAVRGAEQSGAFWQARIFSRGGGPDARGDGALTSGVGAHVHLRGSLSFTWANVALRIAPELTHVGNATPPDGPPARDASRDPFSSPFYAGEFSADLPSRFGPNSRTAIHLGESGLWWRPGRFRLAALTALPRWGPVDGEGLVLGRSAPGVPRVEAQYDWSGADGRFRARWFGGAVQESPYFDSDAGNDRRALSGARLEYHRASALTVELGVARTVMDGRASHPLLRSAVLPLVRAGTDSVIEMLSADMTLRHADAGTVAWLELARQAPVRGLRDLARMPSEGLAFRVGLRQRLAQTAVAEWEGAVEFVRLDQTGTRSDRITRDLYTSGTVAQGWTHLGQPLGSGIGPGGQRQIARVDRVSDHWRIGVFVERVRWNDDALYREPTPETDRHDVTLQGGARVERRTARWDVTGALTVGQRLSYLFQGPSAPGATSGVDLGVMQLGIGLTPRR